MDTKLLVHKNDKKRKSLYTDKAHKPEQFENILFMSQRT